MEGIEKRKHDHVSMALDLKNLVQSDSRFYYEPLLAAHPNDIGCKIPFLGKTLRAPIWITSMTGGAEGLGSINRRLAKVAGEFGLGMGLGSCRAYLEDKKKKDDFNLRPILGEKVPFLGNIGIAQLENYLQTRSMEVVSEMVSDLKLDGVIIHINPLQEWLQPEGDRFKRPPIEVIAECKEIFSFPLFVKEVGQGIGPRSLAQLIDLNIDGIEFGAYGGTNFSSIELKRSNGRIDEENCYQTLGHRPIEMIEFIREHLKLKKNTRPPHFIISGGVKSFLDGHYLINKLGYPCISGQGRSLLKYATQSEDLLRKYVLSQIRGLSFAREYLIVK